MTPTHPDELALCAAVLSEPGEDAPRLVLADWLDENATGRECWVCQGMGDLLGAGPDRGNPECGTCGGTGRASDGRAARAEFIRVQCELAKCPKCRGSGWRQNPAGDGGLSKRVACCGDKKSLRRRERELLKIHGEAWLDGSLSFADRCFSTPEGQGFWVGDICVRAEFRRGFVGSVTVPLAAWVGGPCGLCQGTGSDWTCCDCKGTGRIAALGPAIAAACPLEAVRFGDREPYHNGAGHSWFRQSRRRHSELVPEAAELPDELFDLLPRPIRGISRYHAYLTPEAAHSALSVAALALARSRPLPAAGRAW